MVLTRVGELDSRMGDFEGALTALRRALDIVREIGDRVGEVFVLYGIGSAEHRQGRLTEAETILRAAVEAAKPLGQANILANAMRELGEIATKTGDAAAAVEHLDDAQRRYGELGANRRQAETLSLLEEIRARMRADEGR
jgi:tetratricopeptide (TPR) repeat protein